jgi:carboxylate-amine ligase
MRYSFDRGLLDLGRGKVLPVPQLAEELIELLLPDAEALGCVAEIEHMRTILSRGTSAHRQLAVYAAAIEAGANDADAQRAVVDHLIATTAAGL